MTKKRTNDIVSMKKGGFHQEKQAVFTNNSLLDFDDFAWSLHGGTPKWLFQ